MSGSWRISTEISVFRAVFDDSGLILQVTVVPLPVPCSDSSTWDSTS